MTHDTFGDLRALLHSPASPEQWTLVCARLETFEDDDWTHRILPYMAQHLGMWQDTLRVMPAPWVRALLKGEWRRGMELCRRLVLRDVTLRVSTLDLLTERATRREEYISILNLFGSRIEAQHIASLYASPALERVEHIHLATPTPDNHLDLLEPFDLPSTWMLKSISGAWMSHDVANVFPTAPLNSLKALDLYYTGDYHQQRRLWQRAHLPSLTYLRLGFPRRLIMQERLGWLREVPYLDGVEVLEIMTIDERDILLDILSAHPWPSLKAVHVLDDPRRAQHDARQRALTRLAHLPQDGRMVTVNVLDTQPNASWPEHFRRLGIDVQW